MREGQGVLLFWNDIAPGAAERYRRWHSGEHVAERVAVPGFRRGRRLFGADAEPRWLTIYETDGPEVLTSPAYLARLDDPTPATRAIMPEFRAAQRMGGTVVWAAGRGTGGSVLTGRVWGDFASLGDAARHDLEGWVAEGLAVAAALIVALDAASGARTRERALRPGDEVPPDGALVLELPTTPAAPWSLPPPVVSWLAGFARYRMDAYAPEHELHRADLG